MSADKFTSTKVALGYAVVGFNRTKCIGEKRSSAFVLEDSGKAVRYAPAPGLFQVVATDNVAAILVQIAVAAPLNGMVDIAGPSVHPSLRSSRVA
ncbi:hypothetical protein SB861_36535 [Paraburkholderia sp. SIMBA_049]